MTTSKKRNTRFLTQEQVFIRAFGGCSLEMPAPKFWTRLRAAGVLDYYRLGHEIVYTEAAVQQLLDYTHRSGKPRRKRKEAGTAQQEEPAGMLL